MKRIQGLFIYVHLRVSSFLVFSDFWNPDLINTPSNSFVCSSSSGHKGALLTRKCSINIRRSRLQFSQPQENKIINGDINGMMDKCGSNLEFHGLTEQRCWSSVHAPPAAHVYLPYLHMLLFTPEGKMARLYLNTEITAMPDSDKLRPRVLPPAPNGNFSGIYSKIFNFYSSLGNFLGCFQSDHSGVRDVAHCFVFTCCSNHNFDNTKKT